MPEQVSAGVRVLGVDPGSRITGYGLIEVCGGRSRHLESGCIVTGNGDPAERLLRIHAGLDELIARQRPQEAAVESVFMHRNASSALLLGQARGAALVALAAAGLTVAEYAPAQIKSALVGYGRAEKAQVQHMVCAMLALRATPRADAADALAVALCHAHHRSSPLLALRRRTAAAR